MRLTPSSVPGTRTERAFHTARGQCVSEVYSLIRLTDWLKWGPQILDVPKLRQMAPEFYCASAVVSGTDLWKTVVDAFDTPDFYACMGASPDGLRLLATEE